MFVFYETRTLRCSSVRDEHTDRKKIIGFEILRGWQTGNEQSRSSTERTDNLVELFVLGGVFLVVVCHALLSCCVFGAQLLIGL